MSDLGLHGNVPVRVVHADDPLAEAARLAADLDADVALDADTAEAAMASRAGAAHRAVTGDPAADAEVLARAAAIAAAASATPPLTEDVVEELRQLAADLHQSARIKERTEARVAEALEARVASTTGVTLHPVALASAAEAVVDAEAALAAAERALLEHGSMPATSGAASTAAAAAATEAAAAGEHPVLTPLDDFDEARLDRRRLLRNTSFLLLALAVVAAVAGAAGAPAAAVVVGFVVAAAAGFLVLRRVTPRHEGEAAAKETLAVVNAAVERTESGRRAAAIAAVEEREAAAEPDPAAVATPEPSDPAAAAVDDWEDRRRRLEAARDEAQEVVRLVRSRWHQLAGPNADPHDPEELVRSHDAQFTFGAKVLEASPSVRTAATLHRRTHARWRVMWASLGRDEPPAPDALESVLDEVLAEHRRARDDLAALEAAQERVEAAALARRPLVLVQPRDWVAPGKLGDLLSSLPAEGEVVLVEKPVS